MILAFGNSLSCLPTEVDIRMVLAGFAHLLRPNGLLVVDERNYPLIAANRQEMTQSGFRIPPGFPYCGEDVQARPKDVPELLGVDNELLTLEYDRPDGESVGTFDVYPFKKNQLEGLLEDTGFTGIERFFNLKEPNGSAAKASFITYVARRRATPRTLRGHGERVVMFTDITDSTEARSELGDAAFEREWRKHEKKVQGVVAERRGSVHKTLGDGVLASFARAADAVEAGKEIVAAPGTSKLRVRAGLNMGPVREDADGDISGRAVVAADRICGAAKPDRLLADDRVMLATLAPGVTWTRVGQQQLKGVGKRMLWQARSAGRPLR